MATAQTTRTEEIFTGGNCTLGCMAIVSNDSIVSAYVSFEAKDDRLPTLKNYFTISYDAPQQVYKFLTELEKFSTNESAATAEISKHKVIIENVAGAKVVKVFDEHGLIFHRFSPKVIAGIKAKFLEWAAKNKIKLE
jgi:Lhr-like helicase